VCAHCSRNDVEERNCSSCRREVTVSARVADPSSSGRTRGGGMSWRRVESLTRRTMGLAHGHGEPRLRSCRDQNERG
jgi:hypothetical protein